MTANRTSSRIGSTVVCPTTGEVGQVIQVRRDCFVARTADKKHFVVPRKGATKAAMDTALTAAAQAASRCDGALLQTREDMRTLASIRDEGERAAIRGESAFSCPHALGSFERRLWLDGFTAGRQAMPRGGSDGVQRREFGILRGGRAGNGAGARAT